MFHLVLAADIAPRFQLIRPFWVCAALLVRDISVQLVTHFSLSLLLPIPC